MAMLGGFSLVYACITWALREQTPLLYTTDPEVLWLSASCIRIFSVYLVFSCGIWAVRASLNGTGKQPTSAKIALTSAYLVGIPSAALCCFVFGWGVHGLWVGLTLGNITAVALLLYKVVNIDWARETKVARDRALAKKTGRSGDKPDLSVPVENGAGDDEEADARRGLLDEETAEHSWVSLHKLPCVQSTAQLNNCDKDIYSVSIYSVSVMIIYMVRTACAPNFRTKRPLAMSTVCAKSTRKSSPRKTGC